MRKKEVKTCGRAFTRRIKSKKKKKRLITYAKLVPPHRQSLGAVVDLWKYFVRSADECEPFVFLRFLPCSPFPPRPAPTRPSSYSSYSSSGSPLIVRCEGYRRLFINWRIYKHAKITRNFFHSSLFFFFWLFVSKGYIPSFFSFSARLPQSFSRLGFLVNACFSPLWKAFT